ncbi:hypothetical protein Pcinc_002345 [Petrolisthes cinctipes]|uniref:Uncharacterized protein n=1 Tax=Petrolisthes cinctipes TaxID=88211 RepID=A0AAE1GQF3_PETCI|nr:hypothetical protein Pcinc_002345 [Petrolisthes cinctipes]
MAALIAAVSQSGRNTTPQNISTNQTNAPLSQNHLPLLPKSKTRPIINSPQRLQPDVPFQRYRDWRRRFVDYAMMTNLSTLPLGKQHIQLSYMPYTQDAPHSTLPFTCADGRLYT